MLNKILKHVLRLGQQPGPFRGGMHGNAIPIVKKPPEHMGTAFPLCVGGMHGNGAVKR